MKVFYDDPIERPPFGLSDHGTVETQPLQRSQIRKPKLCIKLRDLRPTKRLAMRKYLEEVDEKSIIDAERSCERIKDANVGINYQLRIRYSTFY